LPPADRKPATLALQHAAISRPIEMISKATFRIDTGGEVRELAVEIKTKLTESTRSVDNQGTADVALQYEKVEMTYLIDGQPLASIKNNDKVFRDIKYMRAFLKVDRSGTVMEHKTDLSNVPPGSRSFLATIGNQVEVSMANLAPIIPNQQVQPKQEWAGGRFLGIGAGSPLVPLKMKYEYVGSRRKGIRDEAVIAVTGEVVQESQNSGFQQNPGMQ